MKKKILIIGGNGFIGRNLANKLIELNYKVSSLDIAKPEIENSEVKYIVGDFFNDNTLASALEGIDVVIHSLSTVNPGNSNREYMRGYSKDFIQTIKLCELVIEKNIKMIFISSGGTVYGNKLEQPILENTLPQPINHYGNIKLCIENTIRTFNNQLHTKILIARVSNPYGPGQDYTKGVGFIDATLKKAISGESMEIWGDGSIERDYIYIDNACEMLATLIEYKGNEEVFNVSLNKGYNQREILQIIEELGLNINVNYVAARSVDVKQIVLDNSKIMSIYHGELVDLPEGIERYYKYLLTIK